MRSAPALLLGLAVACHAVPDQPTPIAYDREACAHCHMLIGEPRYAVQLVTRDGLVVDFDDPGCALSYLATARPAVHRLWFHDSRSDRWLAARDVRFVAGAETPMGYGLAAVDAATPDALTLEAATARVARRAP
jgi:copper chaperone NosL